MSDKLTSASGINDENLIALMSHPSEGLKFDRVFSALDCDPFEMVDWSTREASIKNPSGEVIFEQTDVEAPSNWSDMAITVVASKYFRGKLGSPERESSIRDLISRVGDTIARWGTDQGYFDSDQDTVVFRDELVTILLSQKASFNSPVWFNVGVEPVPQCSACFILGVDDTMESILHWYTQEGIIFKGGSGSGVNLSRLRSEREPLKGGGTASGPISFMKAADASAGVIKSGGKTRRAAKMVILDAEHPDILKFIHCKSEEEKKVKALIEAGFDGSFEGEAYSTVAFQNSNHTVRLSDDFMEADEKDRDWQTRYVLSGDAADTYRAREIMHEIALAAHCCGDPGIQFSTTINKHHTCPETASIRSSNPCSEYLGVDDSACNLASLRLTAFLDSGGKFDVPAFCHAVDIMTTAQDILVDRASYPTPAITRNARNLRALGLGFADLGALLMSLGLPYDSEEARQYAGAITAIMTGEAYCQSAKIASVRRPFKEFDKNRNAMLRVMRNHRDYAYSINKIENDEDLTEQARNIWDRVIEQGLKHGFANSQVTAIAPTGTVAFMMDCDTTGIEPELALIKHKALSGGGSLVIVNRRIKQALERLGYDEDQTIRIVNYVKENGTIEGNQELNPDHLSVFDCAFKPLNGNRFISPEGHVKMMAAVQPFVSGGISKTVNLPNDATVADIEKIYRLAWKLGLKSITVYRDGCKSAQPLVLSETRKSTVARPIRRRLPIECESVRHKFEISGHKGYIHTGFYEDGKVGEIFIRMSKEGSTISGLMDTIATLTSIALQYGVPLEALVNKFSHVRYEPSGFTSNPNVPYAKSLTDYIFRYLGTSFLDSEGQSLAGLAPIELTHSNETGEYAASASAFLDSTGAPKNYGHAFKPQSDAPACFECGSIMTRSGSCYKCMNCGATSGCS
ncbi:MAG: vitamin B12-dependent ribonucleotide reductase [Desulfomonilaceae bacterium]